MYKDIDGIEIETKSNRGIVLDTRKSVRNPKHIGVIIPAFSGTGFTFCPFVRGYLVFDRKIPENNFRTPVRAGEWLKRHTVLFKQRRYTPFNILIRGIYELPGSKFADLRMQVVILMAMFAVFMVLYPATGWSQLLITKALGIGAMVGAMINTYLLFRGH